MHPLSGCIPLNERIPGGKVLVDQAGVPLPGQPTRRSRSAGGWGRYVAILADGDSGLPSKMELLRLQ